MCGCVRIYAELGFCSVCSCVLVPDVVAKVVLRVLHKSIKRDQERDVQNSLFGSRLCKIFEGIELQSTNQSSSCHSSQLSLSLSLSLSVSLSALSAEMATKVQKIMTQPIVRTCHNMQQTHHTHHHTLPRHTRHHHQNTHRARPRRRQRHSTLTTHNAHTRAQNLIFRFLQNKTRVQIWLFENTELRMEGAIVVRLPLSPAPLSARAYGSSPAAYPCVRRVSMSI